MFSVSRRMSTNTGVAPRSTNALIVETNVNDGTITSSPGCRSEQQSGHLERMRARCREQRLPAAGDLLEEGMTPFREGTVAGDVPVRHGLGHVLELTTCQARLVEADRFERGRHIVRPRTV